MAAPSERKVVPLRAAEAGFWGFSIRKSVEFC
jgi:hypothetical protein